MIKITSNNIFTVESVNKGKPELKKHIKEAYDKLKDVLKND